MHIKTQFNIRDLENLTGVKAHTIRIWEKRYGLLEPDRTDTNIRKYNLNSFKRILNVSFLYNKGYKISKIAKLSSSEVSEEVQKISTNHEEEFAIKLFKNAMFEFNTRLFNQAYGQLAARHDFEYIFKEVFIPLLQEIGMLWQIGTIDPIHESFISEAIKQKIILNIDIAQNEIDETEKHTFALFLPFKEIHDIGIMYAQYKLIHAGFKTVYLGSSVPVENLQNIVKYEPNLIFITYLTIQPEDKTVTEFVQDFAGLTCSDNTCSLWLLGPKVKNSVSEAKKCNVAILSNLNAFDEAIEKLKKS